MTPIPGQLGLDTLLGATNNMDPLIMALLQAQQDVQNSDQELNQNRGQRQDMLETANSQREQARQAYQQETANPVRGAGDIMQSMFANIGAGIAGNPSIAEGAQQSQIMERQQRLQALRDEYLEKAEIARQAGQADVALDNEVRANKVSQAHQQLTDLRMKAIDQKGRAAELAVKYGQDRALTKLQGEIDLDRIRATGDQNVRVATAKNEGSPALAIARLKQGMNADTGFYEPTFVDKEVNKLVESVKRGKASQVGVSGQVYAMRTRPLTTDGSAREMSDRLMLAMSPFYGTDEANARFLLTGAKIFKRVGKEYVPDEKAAQKARAKADAISQRAFGLSAGVR